MYIDKKDNLIEDLILNNTPLGFTITASINAKF